MKPIRKVFLTFDVEDFVNERSIKALYLILRMLQRHKLKALFFITGHMAEKLTAYSRILNLLEEHQIGYHSSSHSVRPTILEYTDVADYEEAKRESRKRETSHINPLTGKIEGGGGIDFLRELFSSNQIEAFRAPDYCWSPPHLEALRDLGIKYDFSTKVSREPVCHRNITFYPYPIYHDWSGKSCYIGLMHSIFGNKTTVLNFHHWYFVNSKPWNHFYKRGGNPERLFSVPPRSYKSTENMLFAFESFLKKIQALQRMKVAEVTPKMERSKTNLNPNKVPVEELCEESMSWFKAHYFYEVKHLCQHFRKFFETRCDVPYLPVQENGPSSLKEIESVGSKTFVITVPRFLFGKGIREL